MIWRKNSKFYWDQFAISRQNKWRWRGCIQEKPVPFLGHFGIFLFIFGHHRFVLTTRKSKKPVRLLKFLIFARHLSHHVFAHFFVQAQFWGFVVEIACLSISTNVAIEARSYVGLDQIVTRIDVQRFQKPRMVLKHVLLMITEESKLKSEIKIILKNLLFVLTLQRCKIP